MDSEMLARNNQAGLDSSANSLTKLNEFGEVEIVEVEKADLTQQLGLHQAVTEYDEEALLQEKYNTALVPATRYRPRTDLIGNTATPPPMVAAIRGKQAKTKRNIFNLLFTTFLVLLVGGLAIFSFILFNGQRLAENLAETYGRGTVYLQSGNSDAALAEFEKIVAQNPTYRDVSAKIAQIKNQARVTVTVTPVPATVTVLPVTPMPVAPDEVARHYERGLQAYFGSDWAVAVENLSYVQKTKGSDYLELRGLLSKSYYEYALQQMQQGGDLKQIIGLLNAAVDLDVSLSGATELKALAEEYFELDKLIAEKQWQPALAKLAELQKKPDNYRNLTLTEFNLRQAWGEELLAQQKLNEALEQFQLAADLPTENKSNLTGRIEEVSKLLTPTPTLRATVAPRPTATPEPTFTVAPEPTATPTCRSNFSPYNVGQPNVPEVADKGSSAVGGVVLNRNKAPIANVLVRVSTDGFTFTTRTSANGRYYLAGLGKGTWYVTVLVAPTYSICSSFSATVRVSGEPDFTATADFVETPA
jgi:tetratricopeptide (TPR) repeat protein